MLNFGFFKGPWVSYQKTRKQKNSYQPNFKNLIMKIGDWRKQFFPPFRPLDLLFECLSLDFIAYDFVPIE